MVRESRFAFDDRNSPFEPGIDDPLFDEDDPFFEPYPPEMRPTRHPPRPEKRTPTEKKQSPRHLADADWVNPQKPGKKPRQPRRKSK